MQNAYIFLDMKTSIGKAAKELGVSKDTLRRWEAAGKIRSERTPRGHRRYDLAKLLGIASRVSTLNYQKRRLQKLIQKICSGKIDRLVVTHKDRLLRFGAELIFSLCEQFGIEVILLNKTENGKFEDDLVQDDLEIITVFSARLYGARSRKNQKLLQALKSAAVTLK